MKKERYLELEWLGSNRMMIRAYAIDGYLGKVKSHFTIYRTVSVEARLTCSNRSWIGGAKKRFMSTVMVMVGTPMNKLMAWVKSEFGFEIWKFMRRQIIFVSRSRARCSKPCLCSSCAWSKCSWHVGWGFVALTHDRRDVFVEKFIDKIISS